MNLYLMRHGIAVAADQPGVESDSGRPLTSKGTKRMRQAARGVRRLGVSFDKILTSPFARARQTAEIVAESLGLEDRLEALSELTPENNIDHLVSGLTRFQNREHVLLVGHNPLLSNAFSFFVSSKTSIKLEPELKKGGLCCIEIDRLPPEAPGTLHWFLTPKQLRQLGD
jgi:phosphohistidine phosphatase